MIAIRLKIVITLLLILIGSISVYSQENIYPGLNWGKREPSTLGINESKVDSISILLGGRGSIIKNGFVVKEWGDQEKNSDWLSSVKPLFSTFLFFAIEEGKISGVHHKIKDLGWDLKPKDQYIEFYHLANMISGYARPEKAGQAWAYNDFAIQLYQKSLFEKLFLEEPEEVLYNLLGPLSFQDYPTFGDDIPRLFASVRDFARIGWFWLNQGQWKNRQLLPKKYFEQYMKPQVPKTIDHTKNVETDDYLQIGTFGGGSDHFTNYGAGIYGFNWWFNDTGRLHPNTITWPDAPEDTFMSIGAGGNNMVMIPGLRLILVSAGGNWGHLEAGAPVNKFNQIIKLLVSADQYEQNHK